MSCASGQEHAEAGADYVLWDQRGAGAIFWLFVVSMILLDGLTFCLLGLRKLGAVGAGIAAIGVSAAINVAGFSFALANPQTAIGAWAASRRARGLPVRTEVLALGSQTKVWVTMLVLTLLLELLMVSLLLRIELHLKGDEALSG